MLRLHNGCAATNGGSPRFKSEASASKNSAGVGLRMVKTSDIRRLLQAAYKPVATSPKFKGRLLGRLLSEVARREVKQ